MLGSPVDDEASCSADFAQDHAVATHVVLTDVTSGTRVEDAVIEQRGDHAVSQIDQTLLGIHTMEIVSLIHN